MEVQRQPGLIHSALLIDQLIREKLSNFTGNVAQFKKKQKHKNVVKSITLFSELRRKAPPS